MDGYVRTINDSKLLSRGLVFRRCCEYNSAFEISYGVRGALVDRCLLALFKEISNKLEVRELSLVKEIMPDCALDNSLA